MSENFLVSRVMSGYSLITIRGVKFRVPTESLSSNSKRNDSQEAKNAVPEPTIESKVFISDSAMGLVIGPKGANVKLIRSSSRAKLELLKEPILQSSPDEEEKFQNYAMISGTQTQVAKAENLLNGYIGKAQSRGPKPTHFISLPLSSITVDKVKQLQMQAVRLGSLSPKLAVSPDSFHVTLGLFSLTSIGSIDNVKHLLQSLQPSLYNICRASPIKVQIQDLGTFPENDQQNARVLYSKIIPDTSSEKNFTDMISQVRRKFQAAGVLQDNERELTLHATLLKSSEGFKSFNASSILSKLGKLSLGTCSLDRLQICRIGSCPPGGTHKVECEINIC